MSNLTFPTNYSDSASRFLGEIFVHPSRYFEIGYMQSLIDSIELIGLAVCLQFLIIIMDIFNETKYPNAIYVKWALIALQFPVLIALFYKLIKFYTGG